MTAIYAVTFVMSAVVICKWTLSHYDDDDHDDDDDDHDHDHAKVGVQPGPTEYTMDQELTSYAYGGLAGSRRTDVK